MAQQARVPQSNLSQPLAAAQPTLAAMPQAMNEAKTVRNDVDNYEYFGLSNC